MKAAIYARISADPTGQELGVDRQREDCVQLAEQLGWEIVGEFVDNDISATDGSVRPEYERLLTEVEAGRVDAILAWHPDRLYRRTADLERLITITEKNHVAFKTVTAGDIDLSTASGRMVARMLGAAATHETERAKERMVRAHQQAAASGKWRARRRVFGWVAGGSEVVPAEAAAIQAGAKAVLSGTSLRAVARDWNALGLETTGTSRQFDASAVRDVLKNPRCASIQIYRGREIGKGEWPSILTEDEHRALVALFSNPARRRSVSYERRHQGSSVYRCGVCLGRMEVHQDGDRNVSYRCATSPAHVSRRAKPLDEYIGNLVVERLSKPDTFEQIYAPKDVVDLRALSAERNGYAERLSQLTSLFAEGVVNAEQLRTGSTDLRAKIEAIDARLAENHQQPAPTEEFIAQLVGESLGRIWSVTPADVRGKIVAELLDVTILPSPRGRRKFCEEFVGITELKPEALEPQDAIRIAGLLAASVESVAQEVRDWINQDRETFTINMTVRELIARKN
ncbi:recombinase family protein [Prescottella agglutinans]|uniref:Site-specific DNA recombinase n=1 Tax=Prescottella agglutinans TaxID=1644129 RepID=A0ABT6M505_9NOCA|nr:recombinase family protein [Prescottella agglutinans]MDH6279370.1 site-specific DNA recombinase [Prescottella agglutinans]